MDGFTDNFTDGNNAEAEFLAREKEELAELEDEIVMASEEKPVINSVMESSEEKPVINSVMGTSVSPVTIKEEPIIVKEEPEKIRIWREAQKQRLDEKDELENKAKEELREKAKKELEEWYQQHEEQVAKTREANRSAEKELVADTSKMDPGTEWERISKLCDFNPKTAKSSRDISRMRSIILHVKQNPPVKS